jgi:hypothetical protein
MKDRVYAFFRLFNTLSIPRMVSDFFIIVVE